MTNGAGGLGAACWERGMSHCRTPRTPLLTVAGGRQRLLPPGLLSAEAAGGDNWKGLVPLVQMQGSSLPLTARSPRGRPAGGMLLGNTLACPFDDTPLFVTPRRSTTRTDPGRSRSWRRLPSPGARQASRQIKNIK